MNTAADAQFQALLSAEWTWRLQEFPRLASYCGVHTHDHRMERMDADSRARRLARWQATQQALSAIDTQALSRPARIEAAVYRHQLDTLINEHQHGGVLMPIDGDSAFYSYLPDLWREQPLDSAPELAAHLERLAGIAPYFDDHMELLEEGLRVGRVQPALVMQGREEPLRRIASCQRAEDTPFHQAIATRLRAHPALAARARQVIEGALLPAYRRLLDYLVQRYLPAARTDSIGAHAMPGGEAFYAARVRGFTTLPGSAQEVHDIGLAEVARIRARMHALKAECGFSGPMADFLQWLRTDPQFYPTSAEQLLGQASWIAKSVDAVLPRYFGRLPRQPFGVAPVPEAIAPHYTAGRYVAAAPGSHSAALYWVNTHALTSRALYQLPALTLHEAVPGHHLQFALEAENENLAPFRRAGDLSAHSEGWALYAEYLGSEMGIYRTPVEEFGRASYEMWRACRLVADTGMHALGWGRAQAQALLREHTALSEHEVRTEVDRYIGWPGQALSYKMGEITIRALRQAHEQALGSAFSLRDFHDRLLDLGTVPLPCLKQELAAPP